MADTYTNDSLTLTRRELALIACALDAHGAHDAQALCLSEVLTEGRGEDNRSRSILNMAAALKGMRALDHTGEVSQAIVDIRWEAEYLRNSIEGEERPDVEYIR